MRNNDMRQQSIRGYQKMNNNKLKPYSNIHMQSVRIWRLIAGLISCTVKKHMPYTGT